MSKADIARHWRHPWVDGVDLMTARFRDHAFSRHSHAGFAIGVIQSGVERLDVGVREWVVGAGSVVVINADTVHNGRAGHPEGWAYRVLYPTTELVADVVAELGAPRGTPFFAEPTFVDDTVAAALLAAHRGAEGSDGLAASSLLHRALRVLWRAHGGGRVRRWASPGQRQLDRARRTLLDRMADPPTLDELAAEVGLGRFALLKGFQSRFGLPPHTYLNQERVRRGQELLATGMRVSEVAFRLGFADQAHLTRHFRRIVGVPPGAWSREHLGQ